VAEPDPTAAPPLAEPTAPAGTAPFQRWVTVVATLIVGGAFAGGFIVKRGSVLDTTVAEPLAAFDTMLGREPLDEPLAEPIARDAEISLRALITDGKQSAATAHGARTRLAVVLGERERWTEAQPLTTEAGDASFARLMTCAYGPAPKRCAPPPTCDPTMLAALTAEVGAWAATRACVVAAGRIGDAAATTRLLEAPTRSSRVGLLRVGLEGGLLLVGLIAAAMLAGRRRPPRPPPLELPAPWSLEELYAALIRCALWSLLATLAIVGILLWALHVPVRDSVGVVLYATGLWSLARLVFRRSGLSVWDSLRWPGRGAAGREIELTLLAAIGLARGGQIAIGIAAWKLRHRLPWSDLVEPVDPLARWHLAAAVASTVLFPPLVEELVFRRAILWRLKRSLRPATAILVSTLLFTIPHGYSPIGLLTVFWTGLVVAWAFNRTGNLWPSVAAHAACNAMALWWSLA
jgi:membrane protease YdiL (CAAX protease family)